jgi:uncharacterized surface protein with fasciclin (FAS1) repeats
MKSCFRHPLVALLLVVMSAPLLAKPAKLRDLADTVAANPILTNFASMLQASPGIATFLSSRGPFTLFVPTDSAFAKLPPGTLQMLLRPENQERLQHILLFHAVNGKRLTAKDLLPLKTILSCEGTPLTFRTMRTGTQLVMKAKITRADIRCANGILNEIDTVLMPPETALPPIAAPPAPTPIVTPVVTNTPSASTNGDIPVAPKANPADVSPH